MHIKNFRELAFTPERKAALLMLEAALEACDTSTVLEEKLSLKDYSFRLGDHDLDLRLYDTIYVVGAGKASWKMAAAIEKLLGKRITDGVVIDVVKKPLKYIQCVKGTHPLPSAANQRAAKKISKLLDKANPIFFSWRP